MKERFNLPAYMALISTLHCKKLFPARESLVSDIPAGDGKTANLLLQCMIAVVPSIARTTARPVLPFDLSVLSIFCVILTAWFYYC